MDRLASSRPRWRRACTGSSDRVNAATPGTRYPTAPVRASVSEPEIPIAEYGDVFRALSDPTRTEIVRRAALLDELPCTHLEEALPISKSTISYHVKILFQADLLTIRKEGSFYFYRLREDRISAILPGFLERLRNTSLDQDSGPVGRTKKRTRRRAVV